MASSDEFAERVVAPTTQSANDMFDISSLGQSIEAEELKHFLDHLPLAIVIFKTLAGDQRIVYANKSFESLFGQLLNDLRGRGWSIWGDIANEDKPEISLAAALRDGDDFCGTFCLERPKRVLVEAYTTVIEKDDSRQNYRIVALINVTERERVQREEFARQLRDRETLLLELQHRVKNNLQLVTALIRLEARTSRQGHHVNLEKLAGRIEALRLLYRDISADGAGKTIDLGHYISEIATALINAYGMDGIRLDLKVDHVPASINVAMPAGLIVNELVTNAFKYAFVGKQNGTIGIRCLQLSEGKCEIVVSDDGAGLPEGLSWPVPGKIGALVMQTLRENADTDVHVESTPRKGTKVTIRFGHRPATRPAN
jgi:PAS domain S-box-containing protein